MCTLRTMTKSPVALAREAFVVAQGALAPYSSPRSRHDFTQAQLLSILVLREFFQDRLPQHGPTFARFQRPANGAGTEKSAPLHYLARGPEAAGRKGAVEPLLDATFERARQFGLRLDDAAYLDSTRLESRHSSRHFLRRNGRIKRYRRYPKLTILCHDPTHVIAGAAVRAGPSNDSPDLPPVVCQAARRIEVETLYADAAYDCEAHHHLCREELGIAKTLIPINDRGRPQAVSQTPYRRQMKQCYAQEQSGQRWQVESVTSRFKRRLGCCLRSRADQSRTHECYLRAMTHNLMIL